MIGKNTGGFTSVLITLLRSAPHTSSQNLQKLQLPASFNCRPRASRRQGFRQSGQTCVQCSSMWNPQNTEEAQILPSPAFSPSECVAAQLNALAACDEPWPLHGIRTAYEFGYDIGGLDPSYYFGFRKDLYHFDHFMGIFQNHLPELVNLSRFEILGVEETLPVESSSDGDGSTAFSVFVAVYPHQRGEKGVTDPSLPIKFIFHLRRKSVGARKGSLMTEWIEKAVE